jgi:hypothetical protein
MMYVLNLSDLQIWVAESYMNAGFGFRFGIYVKLLCLIDRRFRLA